MAACSEERSGRCWEPGGVEKEQPLLLSDVSRLEASSQQTHTQSEHYLLVRHHCGLTLEDQQRDGRLYVASSSVINRKSFVLGQADCSLFKICKVGDFKTQNFYIISSGG